MHQKDFRIVIKNFKCTMFKTKKKNNNSIKMMMNRWRFLLSAVGTPLFYLQKGVMMFQIFILEARPNLQVMKMCSGVHKQRFTQGETANCGTHHSEQIPPHATSILSACFACSLATRLEGSEAAQTPHSPDRLMYSSRSNMQAPTEASWVAI